MERDQRRTAPDALATVPGLNVVQSGGPGGQTSIFMRGILKAYGVGDRQVWVADSFEGLPPPDAARYPKDAGSEFHRHETLAVSLEEVRSNFERYGLLDEQVRFLKGWFRVSLPAAPTEKLAIMRLDGDMYESTMDGLVWLYPKLSPGGFCIIDDFGSQQQGKFAKFGELTLPGIADAGRSEFFSLTRQAEVGWNIHDHDVVGGKQKRLRDGFGGVLASDRLHFFFDFLDVKQVDAGQDRNSVSQ